MKERDNGMAVYRVQVNDQDRAFDYSQVADNWEATETENEFRVQVVDAEGFERLAENDPSIVAYWPL
jgi:hypothetical protein